MRVWPGEAYPLGATYDGNGTNFSVFSQVAEQVFLCLFDEAGNETQIQMPEVTGYCWHVYLPDIEPGKRYGYRVQGPYDLVAGHRCCSQKLLLDPYAKAINGQVEWDESLFLYPFSNPEGPMNVQDSGPYMPKSVVINPYFDWKQDRPPRVSLHESIIYETHVKGFTYLHPEIPDDIRGTYEALAHPASVEYFKRLGVTTVELMPVHQFIHDQRLLDLGLRNYWGYNSISFFAPHNEYSSSGSLGQQVQEFKRMVHALHKENIEVILDVVYNHTAEGNHLGPVLCFKGLDNVSYYHLDKKDKRFYMDYTGTGNSLNMRTPNTCQMVCDSLRYWVTEMHVDGFRFDLAAALARSLHDVDWLSAFFAIIQQDPVLGQIKLIAEPWDVGEDGYHVGRFPPGWSEWNGKYRDSIRDYWRGHDQLLRQLASRFSGSSDLYANTGRRPYASINFVTAHDGFTLTDLVTYNQKHNEANADNNNDGSDDNRSWNCGVEGPTDDAKISELRQKQRRNLVTTLLLSQGIPMLNGGDEIGRTSFGNNNTYCQDNKLSWYDWANADQEFLEFVAKLIHLRHKHPTFRRWRWLHDEIPESRLTAIGYYQPCGQTMNEDDWQTGYAKGLQIFLSGANIMGLDSRGQKVVDDDFILLFNSYHEDLDFKLLSCPQCPRHWRKIIDTSFGFVQDEQVYHVDEIIKVSARSIWVLTSPLKEDNAAVLPALGI